ncbi:hypothetical protein Asppvi_004182 [Aspergillus pseudoviridinutans]|uniref:Uncharacterized protein n=1 Tax=Aspergillus pseudoviridinutans TaxID=1517512 RepID=A0A9P3B784_9EURO|nr:uncharacterized protein Asppvi_004182 [Aspergillus pseudoviridinutans]GIJ85325.1 hypothetical protein Asppvi_004182 [Aspergillus pseudoviridinutans]
MNTISSGKNISIDFVGAVLYVDSINLGRLGSSLRRKTDNPAAGGGAYYFAKKSINADRASRYEAELKKKAQLAAMEAEHRRQSSLNEPITAPSENPSLKRANMARFQSAADDVASPSAEAGHDPAPTRHEPETEAERVLEKGKYEATQPFRPPRGNRLS